MSEDMGVRAATEQFYDEARRNKKLVEEYKARIAELGKQVDALQKYNDGAMDEIDKLEYRITELEANKEKTEHMVELLIQAGNVLADGLDTYWQECYPQALGCWHTLVTEWKEQQ